MTESKDIILFHYKFSPFAKRFVSYYSVLENLKKLNENEVNKNIELYGISNYAAFHIQNVYA